MKKERRGSVYGLDVKFKLCRGRCRRRTLSVEELSADSWDFDVLKTNLLCNISKTSASVSSGFQTPRRFPSLTRIFARLQKERKLCLFYTY